MKKQYRVKKEKDFQRVFDHGQVAANRQFVVYRLDQPNQDHFHVGFSVGKKLGTAVLRNRIKRRLRHCIRELDRELGIRPDVDFIIIARRPVRQMTFQALKKSLIHVLSLANIFKQSESDSLD